MRFAFLPRKRGPIAEGIHIAISTTVLDRMHARLYKSDVEEGGKLIGHLQRSHSNPTSPSFEASVVDFIDSGPRVDRSTVHLLPDRDYQYALFRLLERYDPALEHLGSWHSHHCNGLDVLSRGDVEGYVAAVNDANYNIDIFVAFLVVGVSRTALSGRVYAFKRGHQNFYELREDQVTFREEHNWLSPLLAVADQLSSVSRGEHEKEAARRDPLQALQPYLARDRTWILRTDPQAKAVHSRATGTLRWQWAIPAGEFPVRAALTYDPDPRKGIVLRLEGPLDRVFDAALAHEEDVEHRVAQLVAAFVNGDAVLDHPTAPPGVVSGTNEARQLHDEPVKDARNAGDRLVPPTHDHAGRHAGD